MTVGGEWAVGSLASRYADGLVLVLLIVVIVRLNTCQQLCSESSRWRSRLRLGGWGGNRLSECVSRWSETLRFGWCCDGLDRRLS